MARDPRRYFNTLRQADLGRILSGFFDLLAKELPTPGGTSGDKPATGEFAGQTFFNQTASSPIYWDGARWLHTPGVSPYGYAIENDIINGTFTLTNSNSVGTGAGLFTGLTNYGEPGRIGMQRVATGTTASGRGQCAMGNGAEFYIGANGTFYFESLIKFGALSTEGVEGFRAQIGFMGPTAPITSTLDHVNQAVFEYNTTTSPNWILHVAAANDRTRVVTDVPVTTEWTRCIIVGTPDAVEFYIGANGLAPVLIGTITEDIPGKTADQACHLMWRIIKTSGLTNRDLVFDYYKLSAVWDNARA